MAAAYTQSGITSSFVAGASIALAYSTANLTSGSMLVAIVHIDNSSGQTVTGVSDPTNGAWTRAVGGSNGVALQVFTVINASVAKPTVTATVSASTGARWLTIMEYTGPTQVAIAPQMSSAGATPVAASMTPAAASQVVVAYSAPANSTSSVAAPFTQRQATGGDMVADDVNPTSGTGITCSFTVSGAGGGEMIYFILGNNATWTSGAALSTTEAIAAPGRLTAKSTATLAETLARGAAGRLTAMGIAALSETIHLIASGNRVRLGAATLSETFTPVVVGRRTAISSALLAESIGRAVTGTHTVVSQAVLAEVASRAAAGRLTAMGLAPFVESVTLHANGSSAVTLTASASMALSFLDHATGRLGARGKTAGFAERLTVTVATAPLAGNQVVHITPIGSNAVPNVTWQKNGFTVSFVDTSGTPVNPNFSFIVVPIS